MQLADARKRTQRKIGSSLQTLQRAAEKCDSTGPMARLAVIRLSAGPPSELEQPYAMCTACADRTDDVPQPSTHPVPCCRPSGAADPVEQACASAGRPMGVTAEASMADEVRPATRCEVWQRDTSGPGGLKLDAALPKPRRRQQKNRN